MLLLLSSWLLTYPFVVSANEGIHGSCLDRFREVARKCFDSYALYCTLFCTPINVTLTSKDIWYCRICLGRTRYGSIGRRERLPYGSSAWLRLSCVFGEAPRPRNHAVQFNTSYGTGRLNQLSFSAFIRIPKTNPLSKSLWWMWIHFLPCEGHRQSIHVNLYRIPVHSDCTIPNFGRRGSRCVPGIVQHHNSL